MFLKCFQTLGNTYYVLRLVIKDGIYEAGTNNIIIKLYCLLERTILFFIMLYSM